MKKTIVPVLSTSLGLVALLGISACQKPSAASGHEGHGHAAGEHVEATGHVANKDGIAMCTEHAVPEAECAVCKPELAGKLKAGESLKLRLPSENSAGIVGVKSALPESGVIGESVECMAELSYNQNRLALITTPVAGIVKSVDLDLGARVNEGQVLARIWSAPVAEAVAKAVLSHQTLERERRLCVEKVSSEQALQEAEASHRSVCQQARGLGFSEEQIDALGKDAQAPVYLELRAPFSGEIVERAAVRGAAVQAEHALFVVADRSVMWAWIHVPEASLAQLRVGQGVELASEALPGRIFAGKLTWLSPAVDAQTRMVRVRAEFQNPEGILRDKMFASVRILTTQPSAAVLVPEGAVQRIDGKPFVFVQLAVDLFDARAVRLGAHYKGRQEILDGVSLGERVATEHSFAIKSAMMMARMGAGCADD